jgi:hypothetical protein
MHAHGHHHRTSFVSVARAPLFLARTFAVLRVPGLGARKSSFQLRRSFTRTQEEFVSLASSLFLLASISSYDSGGELTKIEP